MRSWVQYFDRLILLLALALGFPALSNGIRLKYDVDNPISSDVAAGLDFIGGVGMISLALFIIVGLRQTQGRSLFLEAELSRLGKIEEAERKFGSTYTARVLSYGGLGLGGVAVLLDFASIFTNIGRDKTQDIKWTPTEWAATSLSIPVAAVLLGFIILNILGARTNQLNESLHRAVLEIKDKRIQVLERAQERPEEATVFSPESAGVGLISTARRRESISDSQARGGR